ncbi:hypothetical protein [Limnobacter alexandrii]|uniref:hypothetical protein n=1 Tax=Limnobacter alexandrii TaxID=2570352 RepID=UPI0011083CC1|nr:hypothetical protein [Limnobacter alexandrii]
MANIDTNFKTGSYQHELASLTLSTTSGFRSGDIFDQFAIFFAQRYGEVKNEAGALMEKAEAHRRLNQAKKDALNSLTATGEKGRFETSKEAAAPALTVLDTIISDKSGRFSKEQIDMATSLKSSITDDSILGASEKANFDTLVNRYYSVDGNGEAVMDDAILNMMIQSIMGDISNLSNAMSGTVKKKDDTEGAVIRNF